MLSIPEKIVIQKAIYNNIEENVDELFQDVPVNEEDAGKGKRR